MRTLTAISIALMAAASAFAAPTASAALSAKPFRVTFAYKPSEGAERIYADLRQVARETCKDVVGPSIRMKWQIGACTHAVVDAGVVALARSDISDLHKQTARSKRI